MEVVYLALLLGVAAIGAVRMLMERRRWQELYVAHGRNNAIAARLHAALRAEGIRCRYRVGNSGALFSADGAMSRSLEARVLVHRVDLHRARQVQADLRARDL